MERVAHILGVIMWMGGLMAAGMVRGPEQPGQPSTRRRLLRGLALPGLVLALLGGVGMWMRAAPGVLGGWFHVKLTLVAILLVFHFLAARGKLSGSWLTPLLVLLSALVVGLAELKPF